MGHDEEDSKDLTQCCFENVLEHRAFAKADQLRGRMRTYLMTIAKRISGNWKEKENRQKRDVRLTTNFDSMKAEERYAAEPLDERSPDVLFQRRWALTVVDQALEQLAVEKQGDARRFQLLRPFLPLASKDGVSYKKISAELGCSEGTIKGEVNRLRERAARLLLDQLERENPDGTSEELRDELTLKKQLKP